MQTSNSAPTFSDKPVQAFQPAMLVREVNVYPVTESELETVASVNWLTTLFCSAALAFASVAASFWIAGETAGGNVSDKASAVFEIVPYLASGAAVLALIAAGIMWNVGASTLRRVKKECRKAVLSTTEDDPATG